MHHHEAERLLEVVARKGEAMEDRSLNLQQATIDIAGMQVMATAALAHATLALVKQ